MKSHSNYFEGNENDKRLIRLLLELQACLDIYEQEKTYYDQGIELSELMRSLEIFTNKILG